MLAHFVLELQALVGPRIAGAEYVTVMVLSIARTAAKLPFCLRRQKIVLHSLFVFVFSQPSRRPRLYLWEVLLGGAGDCGNTTPRCHSQPPAGPSHKDAHGLAPSFAGRGIQL